MDVESAKYWKEWVDLFKGIAFFLVMVGVAMEFLADRVEKPFQKTLDEARENELGQLKKETAEANARAAEAQRTLAPRSITREQQKILADSLRPFAGQVAVLFLTFEEPERGPFAMDLNEALKSAGWTVILDSGGVTSHANLYNANTGIFIETEMPDRVGSANILKAAAALTAGLRADGFEAFQLGRSTMLASVTPEQRAKLDEERDWIRVIPCRRF